MNSHGSTATCMVFRNPRFYKNAFIQFDNGSQMWFLGSISLYSVISNISVLNQSLTSFNCCHLRMLKSGAFYYFINRFIKNPFVIKVSLVILLSFQLTCLFISIGMTNVSLVSFTSLKLVTNKQ